MSMYEVGTVTGAANQAKVTGATTKWSQTALGVQQGSILVVYRNGARTCTRLNPSTVTRS
jgi:hypothetical protein